MFGFVQQVFNRDPASRLRTLMANRNINTNELASECGVTVATISRLRTGQSVKPRRSTADAIAESLGVHLEDIWPNCF
jgi:DNA-binding Xre family transcriptional regulator